MRVLALLVAVCALFIATQAQDDTQGYLGYDSQMEASKNNGKFYLKFTVPVDSLPPKNGTAYTGSSFPVIRIRSQFLTVTSSAAIKFYLGKGERPKTTGTARATKASNSGADVVFDLPIFSDVEGGDYYLVGVVDSCQLCISTVDVKVAPTLLWVSGGVSTVQPFAQQKGFTMDYSLSPLEYGPAMIVKLNAATEIFAKVSFQKDSKSAAVVLTYVRDSLSNQAVNPVIETPTENTKKYPLSTPQSGDFDTGPVTLDAGTWYIAPFGATISTLGTRMQFDFAVGIGEPAAAGTVFPSLVVLLALLASSVYLLL